jgi:hypothetical protein
VPMAPVGAPDLMVRSAGRPRTHVAKAEDHFLTGQTGRSSPPSSGARPRGCVPAIWSPRLEDQIQQRAPRGAVVSDGGERPCATRRCDPCAGVMPAPPLRRSGAVEAGGSRVR